MTEYLRLLNKDSLAHFTSNWNQHDTLVLLGGVLVVFVLGFFLFRRR